MKGGDVKRAASHDTGPVRQPLWHIELRSGGAMPSNSDDDDAAGGEGRVSKRKRKELARRAKWLHFSMRKVLIGFEDGVDKPREATHAIPFCLSLLKVEHWALPRALEKSDGDISFSLSLSFYHRKAKRFFGNTWIGRTVDRSEMKAAQRRGDDDDDDAGSRDGKKKKKKKGRGRRS